MAGCFGNDPYDRWLERETDRYLSETFERRITCEECGYTDYEEDFEYDIDQDTLTCPDCGHENRVKYD